MSESVSRRTSIRATLPESISGRVQSDSMPEMIEAGARLWVKVARAGTDSMITIVIESVLRVDSTPLLA